MRPASLKSREQNPLGGSVWCRTVQRTLGSMRRDAVFIDKRKPGAGLHGVWKTLELPRGHINRPDKDDFSFVPLVHCVPLLDSGQASFAPQPEIRSQASPAPAAQQAGRSKEGKEGEKVSWENRCRNGSLGSRRADCTLVRCKKVVSFNKQK